VLNEGDYVYEPSGVLHDATTALEGSVYIFTCDGSVLYFADDSFAGYINWETIDKLRERADLAKAAKQGCRVAIHVGPLPEGDRIPRHQEFVCFRPASKSNGYRERFIRTLTENLLWARRFETIEELVRVLSAFRDVCNTTWLIERHGFISPA
jgi:hypothetical protein